MSGQTSALRVRFARSGDLAAIASLDSALLIDPRSRDRFAEAVRAGNVIVATASTSVVGFAHFEHSFFGHAFVALLEVHPDHRRRRIATRLLAEVARKAKTDRLFTSTSASNAPMHAVCDVNGFTPSGSIDNVNLGEPEIVYVKFLRAESPASA